MFLSNTILAMDMHKKVYSSKTTNIYTTKKSYLETLQKDIDLNKIKIRFITDFIDENIIIIKKRKTEIEQQLVDNNYPK